MSLRALLAAACLAPCVCLGQAPAACAQFAGTWTGKWEQGYYGTQWIHVTGVSEQCVAQIAPSRSAEAPKSTHAVPINAGVMLFTCNAGTEGTCRLEINGPELRATYSDPTGFVNTGVFHKIATTN